MGIVTKLIKYGIVFAAGYYLGSGCSLPPKVKVSNLEQEVIQYEKDISQHQTEKFFS